MKSFASRIKPRPCGIVLGALVSASAWAQQAPLPGTQQTPSAGTLFNQQPRPSIAAPPPGGANALPAPPAAATPPVPEGTKFTLKGVRFAGNEVLGSDVLLPLVADRIGQEVSIGDLDAMAARIAQAYRDRGYPLAQVVIPPQDVTSGELTFTVLEGKIGRVRLTVAPGAPIREPMVRARLSAIEPGKPLRQAELERTMLLLSDLPGIRVNSALETGSAPGTVDLNVTVEPVRRWNFAVAVDDYGAAPAGRWRLGAVGRLASPFGIGDNLDINLLAAERADTVYGRIGYDAPINAYGTRAGIAYSHLYYYLGKNFSALDAHGDADVVTASISHPLIRSRSQNLLLRGALEYRSLTDKIGSVSFENPQKLYVASVGLSYESRDSFLGGGFNSADVQLSFAHLNIDSALARQIDQGPFGRHAQGNSVRLTMQANRLNAITPKTSFFVGMSGQWANQNLDSSSRITLGGPRAVRAYSPSEAVVDEGLIGTAQLRYAVIPSLTLSAFFDIGVGRYNARAIPGQGANTVTRSGAGIGAFWNGPYGITVDGSIAWRTTGPDTTGDDKLPRVYVQISKSF
ncbi:MULTISPECIES: ShlB/FhaC/HecB family hemolysin secretion/activation protein [unclassified Caballeronia]|uniref:ShlB/FhaC/HecB family hemolysin secretion/activation protein n=1 Tax=unclassified Caballeronia TaxID=2646786 RepID=UPI00285A4D9D|nr:MULTISPECIES: ShlB/FhaC/HecB family hemolysin secretion/activation protein [unclassified Caballeronia]MDR5740967.1 ShlB/FhaC/HecB family hemolysin secretion/activation protein [Caballeronia sp. LZ016]MDR5806865.1 ShlB/FhaC/HecB family hemolysin secretion/activation protein [Caballeronia sp. LZ019]